METFDAQEIYELVAARTKDADQLGKVLIAILANMMAVSSPTMRERWLAYFHSEIERLTRHYVEIYQANPELKPVEAWMMRDTPRNLC